MLEKTLELISGYPAGTYVPDDVKTFNAEELDRLGGLLSRLLYSPSSIRRYLQDRHGVTLTRADFYSEIPTVSEIESSFRAQSQLTLNEIFPPNSEMIENLQALMSAASEFSPPITTTSPTEFAWRGGPFSYSDAMAYYSMIRTRKPNTIIEIGSGWSSRIAHQACTANGGGRIICVEPYPSAELGLLPGVEVVQKRAQELPSNFINDTLTDGDILFIDSTHTIKHDSDCLHIYLRLLPSIDKSILVHVHDIFLPNTLSAQMMRDNQIFWNEQYMLYLYLLLNTKTRVLFSSAYHRLHNPHIIERFMHGRFGSGGGSIWFAQAGPSLRAQVQLDNIHSG